MLNSPKRRTTRQRSGYTVSGEKSGSEARIIASRAYQILSPSLKFSFQRADAELIPQFDQGIGMAAIGGYIKSDAPFELSYKIQVLDSIDETVIIEKTGTINPPIQSWYKFGLHVEIEDPSPYVTVLLRGEIELTSLQSSPLGTVQFLGVNLGTITEYDRRGIEEKFGANAWENFRKKTHLYYPEIYYWEHEHTFNLEPIAIEGDIETITQGEQLILKACNRCARFLPIDIHDERNALGFSNHCLQRAPCTHGAFSRFVIENWNDVDNVDAELRKKVMSEGNVDIVSTYYGFQLECRPCKKFTVNAPLNPMRNAAQRREDSLRRRAFERLTRYLLGIDWIFYKFRREQRAEEFDIHIWKKFNQKCFACGKDLPHVTDMDLDHTLPLAYLWPLDETATCLCSTCNSQKHDRFPFEFGPYREPGKLERLAELTGIDRELLLSRTKHVNPKAVQKLREEIKWFFDDFLSERDYQKIRHGKKAADLIVASLQRILNEGKTGLVLVEEYQNKTGKFPTTITLNALSADLGDIDETLIED